MSENILESGKLYELWAWYESNRKKINTWATVVVLVGIAVAYTVWSAEQKQEKASMALFGLGEPTVVIAKGNVPGADFMKIAEQYPGTSAAERALVEGGVAFFSQADYEKAEKTFSDFLKRFPSSPFVSTAAYGIAACLDAQGKNDAAVAEYQKVIKTYPLQADQAKLALAAVYEGTGDFQKAYDLYDELTKNYSAAWARSAYSRKYSLEQRHPEVKEKPVEAAAPAAVEAVPASIAAPVEEVPANVAAPAEGDANAEGAKKEEAPKTDAPLAEPATPSAE